MINDIISSLKKRAEDGLIWVQQDEGYSFKARLTWNESTTLESIKQFEFGTNWAVPQDYSGFLLIHNGAHLFAEPNDTGFKLLDLESILKVDISYLEKPNWYPVGMWEGDYLIIDSDRVKEGRKDYLLYLESCNNTEDVIDLHSNFETWLDRFIIAQGAKFWFWSIRKIG